MKHLLLSTLALALLSAAPAAANTYDVYSCWAGAGTFHNPNASSAAWAMDQAKSGGHFTAHQDCGTNGANGAMTVISITGYDALQDQSARIAFTAPTGSTIAHVQLWRNAWSYGSGAGASSRRNFANVLAGNLPVSGGQDADGTRDVVDGTRGTRNTSQHGILAANLLSLNTSPAGSSTVEYRVGCGWAAGCPTSSPSGPPPNYFASGVDVYGAQVSVEDSTLPTVSVGDAGLFGGGEITGNRSVVINAASDQSGIKRLAVFADGNASPIGVLDYEQDVNRCSWWKPTPCQNVSDVEIPVDTHQLIDGDHSFVVKAFDAAENEKASTTHYVTIKNAPATPPPGSGNGGNGGTPDDGSSSGGGGSVGLPNGVAPGGNPSGGGALRAPSLSVAFEANGKSKLAAKYGRTIVARGHLADGTGAPIADAQLAYSAVATKPGARVQNLGSVRTDSSGTFAVAVATKLGSRQLRFAYSPQIGGAAAVTAHVQLEVVAPVGFKVGPRRVRNTQAVVFTGRMTAGPMPRKGKLVNLQVVVDGRWHTFATVRSSKTGKFKYRYRFTRTFRRVTYRFRALSRYEAAYPFVAGHSRIVRVRVN